MITIPSSTQPSSPFFLRVGSHALSMRNSIPGMALGWVVGKLAKGMILEYAPIYSREISRSMASRTFGFLTKNQTALDTAAFCFRPFVSSYSFEHLVKVANLIEWSAPFGFCLIIASIRVLLEKEKTTEKREGTLDEEKKVEKKI